VEVLREEAPKEEKVPKLLQHKDDQAPSPYIWSKGEINLF